MNRVAAPGRRRRWVLVFGLVLLLHGGLIGVVARTAAPAEPAPDPVMLIDMAPAPAPAVPSEPPAPEPAVADGQPQPEAPTFEVPPPSVQAMADSVAAPPLAADTKPPPTEPARSEPAPQDAVAEPPPLPIAPPPEAPKPAVVVPRRPPAAPRRRQDPQMAAAEPRQTGESYVTANTPSPPVAQATASAVSVSWQSRLLAHLNRFKRFPAEAQMRHREGTALVHLRLMSDGSASFVRLESSSGTAALDQEAVALISRAQPLPVPDGSNGAIEIAVPIRFTIR